jgi:hypothetical protein
MAALENVDWLEWVDTGRSLLGIARAVTASAQE